MSNPAIEVHGLGKIYRGEGTETDFRALGNVDLSIADGEFVSLIGPSGCGKTTLLKIIDGLLTFDEGELLVQSQPVRGPGHERAVVFQNFALLPWLSVRDNIGFGLKLRGANAKHIRETTDRYIEMVGLEGFADRFPRQLSGGMQQRVGLARALAVDPAILLMDEPFGALDAQTRNILQSDLLDIWDQSRKTVVFVTHAMDEAVFLSDRVLVMSGRPGTILDDIEVNLPRPRTLGMREEPDFAAIVRRIRMQFERSGVLTA